MTVWPKVFSPEVFAKLLLFQNSENDVFDVWVGNDEELDRIAIAFERQYNCTVIREGSGFMTVCCPESDTPSD